jgi:hypothetical protein
MTLTDSGSGLIPGDLPRGSPVSQLSASVSRAVIGFIFFLVLLIIRCKGRRLLVLAVLIAAGPSSPKQ